MSFKDHREYEKKLNLFFKQNQRLRFLVLAYCQVNHEYYVLLREYGPDPGCLLNIFSDFYEACSERDSKTVVVPDDFHAQRAKLEYPFNFLHPDDYALRMLSESTFYQAIPETPQNWRREIIEEDAIVYFIPIQFVTTKKLNKQLGRKLANNRYMQRTFNFHWIKAFDLMPLTQRDPIPCGISKPYVLHHNMRIYLPFLKLLKNPSLQQAFVSIFVR